MYKFTILFSLLTVPLVAFVIFFGGGGHGTYVPFLVLFPLGLIGTFVSDNIKILFFILGLFQFPVYGFLMDKFKSRKAFLFIFLFHISIILIILLFNFKSYSFPVINYS